MLATSGAETEEARSRLAAIVGYGEVDTTAKPFAPPAKKVLTTALQEARRLGNDRISTGHLLLALASEPEGVAVKILTDLGIDGETLRERVRVLLQQNGE